ncbi:gliding motility-associated C-terminal domain-containing protein [bacterium SCSIO 12741]|nr:gliding motility-associated C-terminal domain-containing protein [bacterium SCSIO 12741]
MILSKRFIINLLNTWTIALVLVLFQLDSYGQLKRNSMGDQWITSFVNDHVQGWRYVGMDFTGCAPRFWFQYPNGIRDMAFQAPISANRQGTACLFPSDDRISNTWKKQVIGTYSSFWSGPLPMNRSQNDTIRTTPYRYGIPKPGNDTVVYIFYEDIANRKVLYDEIVVRPNSNISRVISRKQHLLTLPTTVSPYTYTGAMNVWGPRGFFKGHEYSHVSLAEWNLMASTLQCAPEHYWIVIYDIYNSRFQTLQLTPTGFIKTPINTSFIQDAVVRGMRFSTDGKKLAVYSDHFHEYSGKNIRAESRIYLMDFDILTGVPSNPLLVQSLLDSVVYDSLSIQDAYYAGLGAMEFSADNQYLFTTLKRHFVHPSNDTLYRFDAQATTTAALASSRMTVRSYSNGHFFRDMKLGPDRKIYISRVDPTAQTPYGGTTRDFCYGHLDAIYNSSNNNQAMHYHEDEYPRLHSFDSRHPGPDVIHSFPRFDKSLTLNSFYSTEGFCADDTTFFTYFRTECVDSILWVFGDTSNGQPVTATGNTTIHIYPDKNDYPIQVHLYRGAVTDTIWDTLKIDGIPKVDLGQDTVLCAGSTLILGDSNAFCLNSVDYTWSDSTNHPTTQIQTGGTFWLEVENQCGVFRDTILVDSIDVPDVKLPTDTAFCRTDSVLLEVRSPHAQYLWSTQSPDSLLWVKQTGTYSVTVTNVCGIDSGQTIVQVDDTLRLDLGEDTALCQIQGQQIGLVVVGANQFIWDDQSTASPRLVNQAGTYWVSGNNTCNTSSDTIRVLNDMPPQANLGPDTVACKWNTLALFSTWPRSTYLWSSGAKTDTLHVNQSNTYWIDVTNTCGTDRDSVQITAIDLPNPDIPTDTVICAGDSLLFNAFSQHSNYKWNNGSQQPAMMVDTAGMFTVTVTNACGSVTRSIQVDELPKPLFYIPTDTVLCNGESWTMDLTAFQGTYTWDDNSHDSIREFTEAGVYGISVTNRCATDTATFEIFTAQTPKVDLPDSLWMCEGESVILRGDSQPHVTHSWSTGTNSPTRLVKKSGTYWAKAFNECGEDLDSVEVVVLPFPVPGPILDTVICDGLPAQPDIYDLNGEDFTIVWMDGDSSEFREISEPGVYRFKLSNDAGCESFDSIRVRQCDRPLFIPKAFSPNRDGLNETFEIIGGTITEFHLFIFDRWGHIVFESHDQSYGWDGTHPQTGEELPIGIYTWMLEYTRQDHKIIRTEGNVSLIR